MLLIDASRAADVTEWAQDRAGLARELVRYTDTCVACGMCLPSCPTYVAAQNEAESPRGRISLVRGLAEGRLQVSAVLLEHLDHCLTCQACENKCPAQVPYGKIIDGARALLYEASAPADRAKAGVFDHLLSWSVRSRPRLSTVGSFLAAFQRAGLGKLVRWSGLQKLIGPGLSAYPLPRIPWTQKWRPFYPARGSERGRVALFTGCVANLFDRTTLESGVRVLTKLGYGVYVPGGQGCCGAIDLHAGRRSRSTELAVKNIEAFGRCEVDAIVTMASGCGATLSRYAETDGLDDGMRASAGEFSGRVTDISDFVAQISWPEDVRLSAYPDKVVVHTPCTLNNVQKQGRGPYHLLERIPEIQLIPHRDDGRCCGAAGTFMLRYPDMAATLRGQTLDSIYDSGAQLVVTSNFGCAMHLAGGDCQRHGSLRIIHPLTLLEQNLVVSGSGADAQ